MSYHFRENPRFADRLRGKSKDEILQEMRQQFDEDSKAFFEPKRAREPFERHTAFARGFPFSSEEGGGDFGGKRGDIRSHLDDLAARHPEFAEHLLGPPWGDAPFHGAATTLRGNRRRGSGSQQQPPQPQQHQHQNHTDEDARSQASGSSAASGGSGASSHGDHTEHHHPHTHPRYTQQEFDGGPPHEQHQQEVRRHPIPPYSSRINNPETMDSPDRMSRGQRSMSAPPENRQQEQQQMGGPQGHRFVSRVDIAPKGESTSQPQQQRAQESPRQQQQQQQNVRHIPIFVEGRDEPVLPKSKQHDETAATNFARQQQQQQQHHSPSPSPPLFQRPSHYNQHYANNRRQQQPWPSSSHFQEPPVFFGQDQFDGAARRPQQQQQQFHPQRNESPARAQQQQPHQRHFEPQHQPPPPQDKQQQATEEHEPPKPKQTLPKDPLERVAEVQQEVDSLTERVKQYTGSSSRQHKDYMYLDEMLTRELIKLDDIDTEGKENVRVARKNAIKSIQSSISLLESKAPLPGQETAQEPHQTPLLGESSEGGGGGTEVVDARKEEIPNDAPIPLPPPCPTAAGNQQVVAQEVQVQVQQQKAASPQPMETVDIHDPLREILEQTIAELATADTKCEQQDSSKAVEALLHGDQEKLLTKSPKKVKKTNKQQTPVSSEPIPLPPPEPK